VILGLLLLWAFLLCAGPLDRKSNDFWWHLAAGREIVETGFIAHSDVFTHPRAGRPWTNFEWLFQLILYLGWHVFATGGLLVLKAVFLAAQTGLLYLLLRRISPWFALNAGLAAFWVYVLQFRDYLRPEIATYFFLTGLS